MRVTEVADGVGVRLPVRDGGVREGDSDVVGEGEEVGLAEGGVGEGTRVWVWDWVGGVCVRLQLHEKVVVGGLVVLRERETEEERVGGERETLGEGVGVGVGLGEADGALGVRRGDVEGDRDRVADNDRVALREGGLRDCDGVEVVVRDVAVQDPRDAVTVRLGVTVGGERVAVAEGDPETLDGDSDREALRVSVLVVVRAGDGGERDTLGVKVGVTDGVREGGEGLGVTVRVEVGLQLGETEAEGGLGVWGWLRVLVRVPVREKVRVLTGVVLADVEREKVRVEHVALAVADPGLREGLVVTERECDGVGLDEAVGARDWVVNVAEREAVGGLQEPDAVGVAEREGEGVSDGDAGLGVRLTVSESVMGGEGGEAVAERDPEVPVSVRDRERVGVVVAEGGLGVCSEVMVQERLWVRVRGEGVYVGDGEGVGETVRVQETEKVALNEGRVGLTVLLPDRENVAVGT